MTTIGESRPIDGKKRKRGRKQEDGGQDQKITTEAAGQHLKDTMRKRRKTKSEVQPADGHAAEGDAPHSYKSKRSTRKRKGDGLRRWSDVGTLKHKVRYTEKEIESVLQSVKAHCDEKNIDRETFVDQLLNEGAAKSSRTLSKIATLAGLPKRSIQSMSQKLKRVLAGGHHWTKDELQRLQDTFATHGPQWKLISQTLAIGASAERCRTKWVNSLRGGGTRGAWSWQELWALRQGICEATNSLAPTSKIPWAQVHPWVAERTSQQCLKKWYGHILPTLLHYQSRHGHPIERDVFLRHLLRNLKKSRCTSADEIDWAAVNTWWSARLNRQAWKELKRRLPFELNQGPACYRMDDEDEPFEQQVRWLHTAMECKMRKHFDRRLLRHALLVMDARALQMEEEDGQEEQHGEEIGIRDIDDEVEFRRLREEVRAEDEPSNESPRRSREEVSAEEEQSDESPSLLT